MLLRRVLILGALAFTGCNAIYGEPNQVEWPNPPSNYPTTFMRGQVLDFATNQPVSGALVATESRSVSTTSDANGFYNLDGIQAWAGSFEVVREGYEPLKQGLALNGGDQIWNFRIRKLEQ
jgi:hypothetical protein